MKGRRFLLVNPWIYDFAAYDLWAKPLGLLYIASLLLREGWEVNYIDLLDPYHPLLEGLPLKPPKRKADGRGHFYREEIEKPPPLEGIPRRFYRFGMPEEIFRRYLSSLSPPDLILLTSGMTYWYLGVRETIKVIKEFFPSVPVILGGIYATLCHDHAQRISGADIVLGGLGERALFDLIGEILDLTPSSLPDPLDLDSLPYPAFHLYRRLDYVTLLGSRGCPFRCPYCASPLLYPAFRRRDHHRVIEEITFWYEEKGVRDIAFYDDALLLSPQRFILPLLRGVISCRLDVRFHAPNGLHPRGVTEEVAELMRAGGFSTIRLSLETSLPHRQREMGAKVTNEEFERAVRNLHKAGYSPSEIGTYILVGLPHQRKEEVVESIRFVQGVGARPYLAEYSPLPGTPLWQEALTASPFPLEEPLFQNNTLLPCRWKGLSWEDLRLLKEMLRPCP